MLWIGPSVVCLLIVGVIIIGLIPAGPEDALHKFRERCRQDGMTFQESEAAIAIRMAFATLRRRASDLCVLSHGHVHRDQINDIVSHLAIGLAAAHGQDAAKSFIGWVESCPDEEILYDDARAHRHRRISASLHQKGLHPVKKTAMHDDFKNALKIVKR